MSTWTQRRLNSNSTWRSFDKHTSINLTTLHDLFLPKTRSSLQGRIWRRYNTLPFSRLSSRSGLPQIFVSINFRTVSCFILCCCNRLLSTFLDPISGNSGSFFVLPMSNFQAGIHRHFPGRWPVFQATIIGYSFSQFFRKTAILCPFYLLWTKKGGMTFVDLACLSTPQVLVSIYVWRKN